jgi:catechol 2,3-dioxygenase-like lactoylglutathione lyase family enzyme
MSESPGAAESTISVRAIDHVTIVVNDLQRSARFYRDLLGMRQVDRPDFGFPGFWFQAGPTQVHLIEKMDGSSEPGGGLDPDRVGAGLTHHFAFEVDDATAAMDVLTANGVRIQGGPNRRPDGCIQVWFYDPDGHCIEVFDRTGLA